MAGVFVAGAGMLGAGYMVRRIWNQPTDWAIDDMRLERISSPAAFINRPYGESVGGAPAAPGLAFPSDTVTPLRLNRPHGGYVTTPKAAIPIVPIAPGQIATPNPFENAYSSFYRDKSVPAQYLLHSDVNQFQPFTIGGLYGTTTGVQTQTSPAVTVEQGGASLGTPAEAEVGSIRLPMWPAATAVAQGYQESVAAPPSAEENRIVEMNALGEQVVVGGGEVINLETAGGVVTVEDVMAAHEPNLMKGEDFLAPSNMVGMNVVGVEQVDDPLTRTVVPVNKPVEQAIDNAIPPPFCATLPFGSLAVGGNQNQQDMTVTSNDQQNSTIADVEVRRVVVDPAFADMIVQSRLSYAQNAADIGPIMKLENDDAPDSPARLMNAFNASSTESATKKEYAQAIEQWMGAYPEAASQLLNLGMLAYKGSKSNVSPFAAMASATVAVSEQSTEKRWGLATP